MSTYTLRGKRVWVAGHNGMVGSSIVRRLATEECTILTIDRSAVDLRHQDKVNGWVSENRPDAVFVAAAKVGGILANHTYPADFLYDNLMIEANIIKASHDVGVQKLCFLGSSCIYPTHAPQPLREESLLTGPLEPTNEWYAIAKIAGVKLCQAYRRQHGDDFISAMPTNLYGPDDNFDLISSHVIPAIIHKAHAAKHSRSDTIELWGSGLPMREFLYVDDLADACIFLMTNYSDDLPVNVGSGEEISIRDVAENVCRTVGFSGALRFDRSKPDGTPRKLMDNTRLASMGWRPSVSINDGVARTYRWFLANNSTIRR